MAAKVTAYFSRLTPFYLISSGKITDHEQFDAYPVVVEPAVLLKATKLREIKQKMDDLFLEMPAPEERTQDEANAFVALLEEI